MKQTKAAVENKASENKTPETQNKTKGQANINGQQKPGRAISGPKEVAQLVMMRIDYVNSTKDDLTTAVKALADTAKQQVSVYAKQQGRLSSLPGKWMNWRRGKNIVVSATCQGRRPDQISLTTSKGSITRGNNGN